MNGLSLAWEVGKNDYQGVQEKLALFDEILEQKPTAVKYKATISYDRVSADKFSDLTALPSHTMCRV